MGYLFNPQLSPALAALNCTMTYALVNARNLRTLELLAIQKRSNGDLRLLTAVAWRAFIAGRDAA